MIASVGSRLKDFRIEILEYDSRQKYSDTELLKADHLIVLPSSFDNISRSNRVSIGIKIMFYVIIVVFVLIVLFAIAANYFKPEVVEDEFIVESPAPPVPSVTAEGESIEYASTLTVPLGGTATGTSVAYTPSNPQSVRFVPLVEEEEPIVLQTFNIIEDVADAVFQTSYQDSDDQQDNTVYNSTTDDQETLQEGTNYSQPETVQETYSSDRDSSYEAPDTSSSSSSSDD